MLFLKDLHLFQFFLVFGIFTRINDFFGAIFWVLQAPPPQRSSPERNSEVDNVAVDSKPTVTDTETVSGLPSATCFTFLVGVQLL